MAYREKAEVPDYIVDDPDGETSMTSSPESPRKPENPWIWAMVILLAVELAISYFFKFSPDTFVVSAAANVVLASALRINHLVTLRMETKECDKRYERYACKALKLAISEMKGTPPLASVIHGYNKDKLTQPEADKVAEYVSSRAHNA